jgi:recombination protein RecA
MKFLQENPAIANELEGRLRELLLTKPVKKTKEDREAEAAAKASKASDKAEADDDLSLT